MSKEVIFDFDIERIEKDKLTDIILQASSINPENYLRLAEIFRNSPQLQDISINIKDGNNIFWNNFFKILMPEEGTFTIEPKKIELTGDIQNFNCDMYRYIERLHLSSSSISKIKQIEDRFPNLKNIRIPKNLVSQKDIGEDYSNIFEFAKYTKFLNLATNINPENAQSYLYESGLADKFALSDDGLCIINLDRIGEKEEKPAKLRVNVSDLERIGLENLSYTGDEITLVINSGTELSNDMIENYLDAGINIREISVYSLENEQEQNLNYDIWTYVVIRDRLEDLVVGIDLNAPEKERFAEVYKRICSSIIYDVPAAYPLTKTQKEYEEQQYVNCRNLRNGLIEGKCVCAGYADILRNALAMVNVESKYIVGAVVDGTISEKNFKEEKYQGDYFKKKEDGTVEVGEYHAWNKVKLDGIWYNVDPTWDATRIRMGQSPRNCLKTDEEIRKNSKKIKFEGPECTTPVPQTEIDKLFDSKHIYFGNLKVPNIRDITAQIKLIGEVYRETGTDLKNMLIALKEKITGSLKKDTLLKLGSSNKPKGQSKSNIWDLKNWGIDANEFMRDTKSVTENTTNNRLNKKNKDNLENEK